MLGKLCRLQKRCRRYVTHDVAASDLRQARQFQQQQATVLLTILRQTQGGEVQDARKQLAADRCCPDATWRFRQPLRSAQRASSVAAPELFVSIVEIEDNFAHVAASASMASDHVVVRNPGARPFAQRGDKLLDKLQVGSKGDQRR